MLAAHAAPPGEPSDATLHESGPPTPRAAVRRSGVVRYAIGVVAFAALAVVGWRVRARVTESAPTVRLQSTTARSIAVLPLKNHSDDPRDATLADGMTEELIATLAKVSGLRVIASTSVFALPKGMDVRRIADTLGVAYVVEGNLQKTGSRLRVQVRLLNPRDESTLWSETYDRELRDVFAVEDDIAGSVVRELNVRIGSAAVVPRHRQPTQNVAAYELYRHGSDKILIRTDSGLRIGIALFQQAIALDSTYAAAWAGLGRMYRLSASERWMPLAADRERYHALAEDAVAEGNHTGRLARRSARDARLVSVGGWRFPIGRAAVDARDRARSGRRRMRTRDSFRCFSGRGGPPMRWRTPSAPWSSTHWRRRRMRRLARALLGQRPL